MAVLAQKSSFHGETELRFLQAKALIAQLNPEKPGFLGGSDSGNLQGQEGDAAKFENLWLVAARRCMRYGVCHGLSINGVVYPKSPIDTVYYSHYSRDESYGKTKSSTMMTLGRSFSCLTVAISRDLMELLVFPGGGHVDFAIVHSNLLTVPATGLPLWQSVAPA